MMGELSAGQATGMPLRADSLCREYHVKPCFSAPTLYDTTGSRCWWLLCFGSSGNTLADAARLAALSESRTYRCVDRRYVIVGVTDRGRDRFQWLLPTNSGTSFLWKNSGSAFIAAIYGGSCEPRLVLVEVERVLLGSASV
jgi:hypothetical protein